MRSNIVFFILTLTSITKGFFHSFPTRSYIHKRSLTLQMISDSPSSFFLTSMPSAPMFSQYENNRYPHSKKYYERAIKRLNSQNNTIREQSILGNYDFQEESESEYEWDFEENDEDDMYETDKNDSFPPLKGGEIRIIIRGDAISGFLNDEQDNDDYDLEEEDKSNQENTNINEFLTTERRREMRRKEFGPKTVSVKDKKSEHFEVVTDSGISFKDIGGYDSIKSELNQCIDILKNMSKYDKYNVRVPKGLIFEGPPGNGKTLIAKALATEAKIGFISVSGSEFQEKYVGVGASRIRELFGLAKKNAPCVIFIDEMDALGRKRSGDGESSSSERDSTLNELLVAMDGFKNASGVFVVGATNRVDLLDSALMRPGRIDKKIYIGLPDSKTREAIIGIHIRGKPYETNVKVDDLVEHTNGLSGAQIENVLNEAMLNALREDRETFNQEDVELVMGKMMVGWQSNEHQFSTELIEQIAVHEMGHVIVGLVSKNHANISKVIINLYSPSSPAYTMFEQSSSSIYTRESLFEHIMILLAGRIAEETVYGQSVTTGAINDFEEALKLAEKMVTYYGMGKNVIYPSMSDKYKEQIDEQVASIIHEAYDCADVIVKNAKEFIVEGAKALQKKKILRLDDLSLLLKPPSCLTIDKSDL